MRENPLISVIIPIYNGEKFLEECVNSVLEQNYKEIELLLVDDGSTDSSAIICDHYATLDFRVRVFHKENKGVGDSRNVGLINSKGNWVFFCDADDRLMSTSCLEAMIGVALSLQADVVRCDYYAIDEKGRILKWKKENTQNQKYSGAAMNASSFMKNILDNEFFSCCSLFKKEVIDFNKIKFPLEIKYGEDKFFWIILLPHLGICTYLSTPFYGYRKHQNSVSYKKTEIKIVDSLSVIKLLMKQYDFITDYNLKEQYLENLKESYLNLLMIIGIDFYKEREKIISKNNINEIRKEVIFFCRKRRDIVNVSHFLCFSPLIACHILKLIFSVKKALWEKHEKIRFFFLYREMYVFVNWKERKKKTK